jgi:hypothetical protein
MVTVYLAAWYHITEEFSWREPLSLQSVFSVKLLWYSENSHQVMVQRVVWACSEVLLLQQKLGYSIWILGTHRLSAWTAEKLKFGLCTPHIEGTSPCTARRVLWVAETCCFHATTWAILLPSYHTCSVESNILRENFCIFTKASRNSLS